MRLNLEKCTLRVRADNFFGFYSTEKKIKANPDKCKAFIAMSTLDSKRKIQVLRWMFATLSKFIVKYVQHVISFLWTKEYEVTLTIWRKTIYQPMVLSQPKKRKPYAYT